MLNKQVFIGSVGFKVVQQCPDFREIKMPLLPKYPFIHLPSTPPTPHANLSLLFPTTQIGFHTHILAPNTRSSSPHAESLEEELIYITKGTADLWMNGNIFKVREGDAVGFKAGTGIGHCLINSGTEDVEYICVGDRTKKENKCAFLVNPELIEEEEVCYSSWEL